jgi:hypothetical protein
VSERAAADERLYERYRRSLEINHQGELVAISDDGQVILGQDELAVTSQAIQPGYLSRFGSSGTFGDNMSSEGGTGC